MKTILSYAIKLILEFSLKNNVIKNVCMKGSNASIDLPSQPKKTLYNTVSWWEEYVNQVTPQQMAIFKVSPST